MPIDNRQARQTAMICHLSAYLGFVVPFASLAAPLIVWLSKRREDPFIDEHGREAVNFQLSLLVYFGILLAVALTGMFASIGGMAAQSARHGGDVGAGPIMAMLGGFGIVGFGFAALGLVGLVFPAIAAFRADKGEPYRYPLTMRLVR